MSSLTKTLLSQAAHSAMSLTGVVSEFTPAEIRQTISDLVAQDKLNLANALSDAGLSLYPQSEEILAISALLAEVNNDWPQAEQLLLQLIAVQGSVTSPMAWRHLIRVQRCHCEPGLALASAEQATKAHPHDQDLAQELSDLRSTMDNQTILPTPTRAQ